MSERSWRTDTPQAPVDLLPPEIEVLGEGPRIEPLPIEALTADLQALLDRFFSLGKVFQVPDHAQHMVEATANVESLTLLPEVIRTMLRHAELYARQTDLGIQLLINGVIPARDREMLVLRTAWLCRAPYEWGEHVMIAKRVGVTDEDVLRIIEGPSANGWSVYEAALMRAVDELLDNSMISDATWNVLAQHLDDKQLIELPILIGQYQAVAYSQNSLRLRLHPGNDGLRAR